MARLAAGNAATFIVSALLCGSPAAAEEAPSTDYSVGDRVPLDENDLGNITLQVLAQNPQLSSSPGIKFAGAQRSVRSIDLADIVYHPHADSGGVKQAFQVQCWRQVPIESWTCDTAEIRRYLQLDSQEFEVRIRGGLSSEEALALISASRDAVQRSRNDDSSAPQTAIMVFPYNDSYLVTWGSAEGYQELTLQARLKQDGDPASAEAWQVNIYVP